MSSSGVSCTSSAVYARLAGRPPKVRNSVLRSGCLRRNPATSFCSQSLNCLLRLSSGSSLMSALRIHRVEKLARGFHVNLMQQLFRGGVRREITRNDAVGEHAELAAAVLFETGTQDLVGGPEHAPFGN